MHCNLTLYAAGNHCLLPSISSRDRVSDSIKANLAPHSRFIDPLSIPPLQVIEVPSNHVLRLCMPVFCISARFVRVAHADACFLPFSLTSTLAVLRPCRNGAPYRCVWTLWRESIPPEANLNRPDYSPELHNYGGPS